MQTMTHRNVTHAPRGAPRDLQPPFEVIEAKIIERWRQRAQDPRMKPRIRTLYASLVEAWEDQQAREARGAVRAATA